MRAHLRCRWQPQPYPRLPLDQLHQVGEVALPQPGADGGDERLRDLRRDRDGDAGISRDVEEKARVLGGQRERELRRPAALVDAFDHAEIGRASCRERVQIWVGGGWWKS